MKKSLTFFRYSITILMVLNLINHSVSGKNPVWSRYTCGNYVNYIAIDGEYFWKATTVGLVKVEKSSGKVMVNYDRLNSKLPVDNIVCVAVDGKKNVWAGTVAGLAKFDGSVFTVYKKPALGMGDGLPSNIINCLYPEGEEIIWIGTTEGLASYNFVTSKWTVYKTTNSGLPDKNVTSVYAEAGGIKWIGTSSGLSRFDGSVWKTYNTSNSGLSSNSITCVKGDNNGNIWAGTAGGGIGKLKDTVWTIYNKSNSGLPDDNIKNINIDNQNIIWAVSGNVLMKYAGTVWTSTSNPNSGLTKTELRNVVIDEQGNKWVSTKGRGIAKLAATGKKSADTNWTIYNVSISGLPDDDVNYVAKDYKGNIWTISSGKNSHYLSKYDWSNWTVYDLNDYVELPYYNVELKNLAIDNKGVVYIGTADGLIEYTGTIWNRYSYTNSPLPYTRIYCLEADAYGNKWVGTMGGLVKISGKVWTVYDRKNTNFPDDWINCIAVEKSGSYWVGLFWEGFVSWDGGTGVVKYNTSNSKLPYDNVECISIDSKKNKWVGALNTVSIFDGYYWTVVKDLAGYVKNIAIDKSDIVYFNMEKNGFVRVRNLSMANYKVSNSGLIDDNVNSIAVDLLNNAWLATNNGLSVFNEAGINYVGVDKISNELQPIVSVYPNPADRQITVSLMFNSEEIKPSNDTRIQIYDIAGREIKTIYPDYKTLSSEGSININTEELKEGLYILKVASKKYTFSEKIVIQ